jgi:hypothetical protein
MRRVGVSYDGGLGGDVGRLGVGGLYFGGSCGSG